MKKEKVVKIKKGFYRAIEEISLGVLSDTSWVETEDVPKEGLHTGHYCYWTIIPGERR